MPIFSPNPDDPQLDLLNDLFARIVQGVYDATHGVLPAGTVVTAEWPYAQNVFPYVHVRWLPSITEDMSEDIDTERQRIGIRIITGNAKDVAKAAKATQLYASYSAIRRYYKRSAGKDLITSKHPSSPDWLLPSGVAIDGHSGSGYFPGGGDGATQVGAQIDLEVPIFIRAY